MTVFRAFHNQATVKAQARIDAQASTHPGWSCVATDIDRSACTEQFGLDPAFINLLALAAWNAQSPAYLAQAIDLVPIGADTLASTRDWILRIWRDPKFGIRSKVAATAAHAPALEIIRLVEASAEEPISREAWRKARTALSAAKAQTPVDAPVLDLVGAMAWDLAVTPRLTTDIWNAWEESIIGPVNRAAGWHKAAQDEVLEEVRRTLTLAGAKLGPRPDEAGEATSYEERHKAEVDSLLKAAGYAEKFEAMKAHFTEITPLMMQWRETALQSVLDGCRDARPA
jgi:hypothetical protein